MMGRRQGKTYSVAMYVACMLLLLPGVKIAAFAHLVMLSEAMLETIYDMLKKAFKTSENGIEEKNFPHQVSKRRIEVYHPNGEKSMAFCVPATRTVGTITFLSFLMVVQKYPFQDNKDVSSCSFSFNSAGL